MSAEHDLAKAIADAVETKVASMRSESTTMPAVYQGTDSEGKSWVLLPGATEPTPVSRMAVEAAQGDTVSVTVANGKATVNSNISNPSAGLAGVKVVERTANVAKDTAVQAIDYASAAQSAATVAQTSADVAYRHADEAAQEAANAQASAATANAAAVAATEDAGVAHAMAESATADAATASASATVAKESADKATFALSDVENVVGTLNWIAEHGEYVLTSDTAIVDGKAYYTRSGTAPDYTYTVVASPDASELSTYYELSLDESVQNYLASHLWLDDYGLNLSVDSANGYRVHQGTVDGTHAAGAYIIDPQGAIVASFGAGGFQIGLDDESHLIGDYHSLQLIDKEGDTYFYVSDLRGADGTAEITTHFDCDGSRTYDLYFQAADTEYTVTVSDGSGGTVTKTTRYFRFSETPTNGAVITVVYRTADPDAKAYTLGYRMPNRDVGPLSYAEGGSVTASGLCSHAEGALTTASGMSSHAEGRDTVANGQCAHAEGTGTTAGYWSHAEGRDTTADFHSHAEGRDTTADMHSHAEGWGTKAIGTSHAEGKDTEAKGSYSHAQNLGTKTLSQAQTALGKYNATGSTYAVIVGNGTSDSARSNALTTDWDGIVGAQNVGMYGTCDTAAATADKVATLDDYGVTFKLVKGAVVRIYMANSNTVADPTLNVNSTGAKAIKRYGTTAPSTASGSSWIGGTVMTFLYDGTYWRLCDYRNNDNTVPSAYCSTEAATAAKVASCSGYALKNPSWLHVVITNSNSAASALTLNVNGKGAKPIYINGSASSDSNHTLPAGSYLVRYDGTAYQFRTDSHLPIATLPVSQGGSGQTGVSSYTSDKVTAGTSVTISEQTFKKWGKVVTLRFVYKRSAAVSSGNTLVGTISDTALRPGTTVIVPLHAASAGINAYIESTGKIYHHGAMTANASYTFGCTYVTA